MKRKIGQKLNLNKITISNLGIKEKRGVRGGAVDTTSVIVDPTISHVPTCSPCSTAHTYGGHSTCNRIDCLVPVLTDIES
jgi:hypothetical protein